MAFTHRDNSGTLFKNDRKTKDNQPDYRGECNIDGKILSISAWIKEGNKGKFMSLAFSEPRSNDGQEQSRPRRFPDMPRQNHEAQPSEPPFDENPQFKEDDLPF